MKTPKIFLKKLENKVAANNEWGKYSSMLRSLSEELQS